MANENSAGKLLSGGAWLGLAKLWFLVAGYGLAVALTHLISEASYGQYQTVARAVAVPNMVIIYTVMFAVSRPLSAQFEAGLPDYQAIRRRGLRLAALLGVLASGTVFLAAPWLARWWQDPALVGPLRAVAPISLIYALYAVNIGTLNASRRFGRQAALDVTMATLKAGLIAGAAAMALSLTWIVAGFTAAAVCALGLSVVLVVTARPASSEGSPRADAPPMAAFAGALILFTAVLNLLQSADLLILSSFSTTQALKEQTGYYSSAQLVAWIPYALMNAVALVAFPLVASLTKVDDAERTQTYVDSVIRVTLTLLALMAAVAASASGPIQTLLFPKAYAAAAGHLRLLVLGYSGYAFANIVAWMCNSAGKERAALAIVAAPLLTAVPLAFWLCPSQHAHGVATAVLAAGGVAAIAAFIGLARVFAVRPPWVTLAQLGLAAAAVVLVSVGFDQLPGGKLMVLVRLTAQTLAFIAVAFATGAVSLAQLRELAKK
ncbi:hypothetical protein PPSIR1_05458 [Plesiocystis pacifica SIR-1]|uniref:Polysaccharide biosynthesis protein n=1 Tax=Plesiocystis pacifica SIR-1 TaxID=391625 RepID=A6FX64_9BACT|nr:oligosaccharide flippase family protein [Plesiocystis pacifica]EDM81888.1 hypothetical protein PPSIR1_05458 [Plesiocystis pacifica SIR-1]